jgi:urease accessory protein UreE
VGDGPAVADRLHELCHHPDLEHAVEYLYLDVHDLDRKRLRATSDAGTNYAVVLPRDSALADGAEVAAGVRSCGRRMCRCAMHNDPVVLEPDR